MYLKNIDKKMDSVKNDEVSDDVRTCSQVLNNDAINIPEVLESSPRKLNEGSSEDSSNNNNNNSNNITTEIASIDNILVGTISTPLLPTTTPAYSNYHLPETFGEFLWEVFLGPVHSDESSTYPPPPKSNNLLAIERSPGVESSNSDPLISDSSLASPVSTKITSSEPPLSSIVQTTIGYLSSFLFAEGSPVINITSKASEAEDIIHNLDMINMATPLVLEGRDKDINHSVLTQDIALELRRHMPRRLKDCTSWKLVYSLEQHGISMQTLYGNMKAFCEGYCGGSNIRCANVLIIKDSDGGIFGGFVTECWRANSGSGTAKEASLIATSERAASGSLIFSGSLLRGRSYYGTGESFVFNVTQKLTDTNAETTTKPTVSVYEWAFKNDYFMLSESDFIAMGGGDGKFSLYIDGDLYRGCSAAAPTFTNDKPLCSDSKGEFTCVALEVWCML